MLKLGDEVLIVRAAPKVPKWAIGLKGDVLRVEWPSYVIHLGTRFITLPYWAVQKVEDDQRQ